MTVLDGIRHPIVQAPMAGGISTPALAAAVSNAGGLGFVAAGYLPIDALADQLTGVRDATEAPFGVNVFSPPGQAADPAAVEEFCAVLAPMAQAHGVELGQPRSDDDGYDEKLDLLERTRPAVVSFVFGCPSTETVSRLQQADIEVWVTITNADEAAQAVAVGADGLVAQGSEAGAHRGGFTDGEDALPLDALLEQLRGSAVPVVATGGIMTGADIARVLEAGAAAAQLGTAFMLSPEAATSAAHRRALMEARPTTITRAFTGRRARSLVNAWTARFSAAAPSAYPEVHHVTAPLRSHGRATGDPELINLWAGANYARARQLGAAEIVRQLADELAT